MLANFINLDGTGVGEETYLLRSHFDVQALKAEFNRCMHECCGRASVPDQYILCGMVHFVRCSIRVTLVHPSFRLPTRQTHDGD